jgi:hypothetical protein
MTSFRSRPRFEHTSSKTALAIKEVFGKALPCVEDGIIGQIFENHLILRITPEDQHVWSPQLSLDYEEDEDGEFMVRGVYGPMPSVWTKFAFGHFVSAITAFFALIIGGSKYMLDESSYVLWLFPIALATHVLLYVMAQTGQKLGAEQLFTIHHFYEKTMKTKVHIN